MATGSSSSGATPLCGTYPNAYSPNPLHDDSEMDSRDTSPQNQDLLSSSSVENASSPLGGGPGWQHALNKRRAKKLRRQARQAQNPSTPDSSASVGGNPPSTSGQSSNAIRPPGTHRPKLQPLPKNDIKVVIRPTRGLALKTYPTRVISAALVHSCRDPTKVKGKYILRPHVGSKILVISTLHEETAAELCKITHLTLDKSPHPVRAYVPFPATTLRGVIHGLDPQETRDTLVPGVRIRDNRIELLDARILGSSTTALLTLEGTQLPRSVYYDGCEYPCFTYRPARQFCHICMQPGHCPDVCPTPKVRVCRLCGAQDPPITHQCQPKCGLCACQHETGSRECLKRLKPARTPRPATNKGAKKMTHQSRKDAGPRIYNNRWFSSDDEETTGCNQSSSRSRSRSNSRPRTKTPVPPPALPAADEGKRNKKTPPQGQKQVSWAEKVQGPPAPSNDPRFE
ncbi:uncharacterized protein LOC144114318 [Amblyomma americanum]